MTDFELTHIKLHSSMPGAFCAIEELLGYFFTIC